MNDFQPNEGFQNVPSLEEEEINYFFLGCTFQCWMFTVLIMNIIIG